MQAAKLKKKANITKKKNEEKTVDGNNTVNEP
jgi:hypothetical protein